MHVALFVFIHDTSLGESFCIVNVCLQAIDLIDMIFYRNGECRCQPVDLSPSVA